MNSRDYWKRRSLDLERLLHDRSEATVRRISALYDAAQESILRQIGKTFSAYVRGGALNEKKAQELLSVKETEAARSELLEQYRQATGQAKRDIWARLSAPAYANRISRLEALRDRLYSQSRQLAAEEEQLTRERLADTLEQSYYRTTFDIQQFTGEGYSFGLLDDRQIAAALAADWCGENWSGRIWDNNQDFADAVEETVTVGIMAGLRYDELRDNLLHVIGMDETAGAKYRAARLVKTECAYVANQGHLMGYEAAEIENYIFLATLDLKTSAICRKLDMKRFPVSAAQAGTNLPPMHPHCRSTTMPDMTAEQLRKTSRFARDPATGKAIAVPGDMSYQEWYGKYVEGKEAVAKSKKPDTIGSNPKGDGAQGVQYIGEIDRNIYSCITPDMQTNEVIITDNQLEHIQTRHPDAYQSAVQELKQTLLDPDYIFQDKHPNTGLVIRRKDASEKNIQIVLRVCTSSDNPSYKNSVISAWEISEKRLENYLRHKKVLYRRE